jgi:hypothetical protein
VNPEDDPNVVVAKEKTGEEPSRPISFFGITPKKKKVLCSIFRNCSISTRKLVNNSIFNHVMMWGFELAITVRRRPENHPLPLLFAFPACKEFLENWRSLSVFVLFNPPRFSQTTPAHQHILLGVKSHDKGYPQKKSGTLTAKVN